MKEEKRKSCKRNQSGLRKGDQYGGYLFERGQQWFPGSATKVESGKVTNMVGTFLKKDRKVAMVSRTIH